MSNVEDIRKVFQDFIAPEVREISANVKNIQAELPALELRLMKVVEAAKNEILLTLKVRTQEERIAELTRENERLKGQQTQ